MKIRQITETTAGATASGSVASVARPLGKMQERSNVAGLQPAEKVMRGKAKKKGPYTNSLLEGKMKDLAYDIQHMDNGNFLKKYGQPKDYFTKKLGSPPPIKEAEIVEADLIVVPGMRRMKDTSFIPHKADRRDHEVEMARSDLYAAAKDAMRIFKLLKGRSEDDGLMGWQQSYITLAADYLNSVADSIEYNAQMNEMLGGVLAGGMSNFEENSVNEISDFKKKEIEHELRNEPANNYAVHIDGRKWKVFKDKAHAEAVARKLRAKGKDVKVHLTGESPSVSEEQAPMFTPESKCPHCGGEMVSEDQLNEKKDACYYKVKARYKVWPSAYASGALVKCRKKGSKNWGKGKKK